MQWTEAEIAQLQDLTKQGLTASEIGLRLGKTRNAIIGKWGRMGDQAPQRRPHGRPPVWNSEKVEQLQKLWISGYKASQIADEMEMSLAAVQGKIQQVRPNAAVQGKIQQVRPKHKNAFPLRQMHKKPPKKLKEHTGGTVPFREHLDSQCRYIVGEPAGADTLYCAGNRLAGLSWCPTHFELCTTAAGRRAHRPFLVLHPNARLELAPE